ncbi:potassium/proton antiporter [Clostridium sp. UBA4548]|uniref:potassium/proton antiporter n=1 Tax=Clostridium sp. UBA4548 TaxID=1946361 RepID=UPI0025C71FDF|nr:potassium/proton antiporter [Clostridium sp. UBA4548]
MTEILLLSGIVLLASVLSSKLLYRFGIPTLLIFLTLGMLLGYDGIGGIYFDDSVLTQQISNIGLVFIMFYGGFGVNWKSAKSIAPQAILLSTVGVVLTAIFTGVFAHFVLKVTLLEGMLLGAIVSSTDAASVFSVLRSRKLNLKGGLAPMLEIESGSNDPVAYMLTVVILSLITSSGGQSILQLLVKQIIFGLIIGVILAVISVFLLRHIKFEIDGLYPILVIAIVILGYALSDFTGGNGFLAVYIIGIVMGNNKIPHKKSMDHFFDGVSWLMQIILFFTLGLLVFPSQFSSVLGSSILIAIFLVVIARPIAVSSILIWFKTPIKQQLLVSWVGLRGAASIVFATYALTNKIPIANEIFNTVFIIALLSVSVQGALLPKLANKLDLVEEEVSQFKVFNDYEDETYTQLIEMVIKEDSPWVDKMIMDADIPEEILVVMIKRKNEVITPKGSSVIKKGDTLVLTGNNFQLLKDITVI